MLLQGQEMLDVGAKVLSIVASYNATIEAASRAFYASLITALISVLTCLITVFFTWRQNQKTLIKEYSKTYKEVITAERIKWLNKLRDAMCSVFENAFLSCCRSVIIIDATNVKTVNKDYIEALSQFEKSISLVVLMLNPNENDFCECMETFRKKINEKSKTMFEMANGSDNSENSDDISIDKIIYDFRVECQKLLKKEWDQIKSEAAKLNNVNTEEINK